MHRKPLVTLRRVTRHHQSVVIGRLIVIFCFLTSLVSLTFVTRVSVEWNSVPTKWSYMFERRPVLLWNDTAGWVLSAHNNATAAELIRAKYEQSTAEALVEDDNELLTTFVDDNISVPINTSLPLVNQYQFGYVINCPNVCAVNVNSTDSDILLLIYVHTAVEHFDRRDRIRLTWGNESNYQTMKFANRTVHLRVRTVFVLGLSPRRSYLQPALEAEARLFGDIIQKSFHDTYRYVIRHLRPRIRLGNCELLWSKYVMFSCLIHR
jgi:hypothetical protein